MLKRWMILALVLLAFPAAAQGTNWSLYLSNGSSGQLLRITLDGQQEQKTLALPSGAYIGTNEIDFSADGSRAAYCTVDSQSDTRLTISDFSSTAQAADLGKSLGCWVKYSADSSQIAVGIVRYYPGDPAADTSLPAWELLVVDAATGQTQHEMNPSKASFANAALMPEVRYFADGQIIFVGIPWGTEGVPGSPAYLWPLSGDSIQPVDRWWRPGVDSLAQTGELVWLELDPSRPAADPGGPLPQNNIVQLADKSGQARTIFASPDWVLTDTVFIDNGQQLAIEELAGFDQNQAVGSQPTRWIALDRSGSTTNLATSTGLTQLVAAPDGYVLLWASDNTANAQLKLEYHGGGQTTPLWQGDMSNGAAWQILWSAPVTPASGLQPFPAVNP